MTVDEFIKYVCDQYRDIFKDNYQEGRAKASAERLLAINKDNPELAKSAADAIISYTKAKVEAAERAGEKVDFDDKLSDKIDAYVSKYDKLEDAISDLSTKASSLISAAKKEGKDFEDLKNLIKARFSRRKDFDDKEQKLPPRWMFKYGDHTVDIIGDDRIILDGVEFQHRTELLKPFEEVLRGIQQAVEVELVKRRQEGLTAAPEKLAKLKEMVKDAPKEILHSFNEVVTYFDAQMSLEDLAKKLKDHKKITIGDAEYDLVNVFVEQGSNIVVVYGKDGREYLTESAAKELLEKGSTPDGNIKIQIKK